MIPRLIVVLVVCVAAAGLSRNAAPQDFSREGTFEIGGAFQWFAGHTLDGSIEGVPGDVRIDEMFGGGIPS